MIQQFRCHGGKKSETGLGKPIDTMEDLFAHNCRQNPVGKAFDVYQDHFCVHWSCRFNNTGYLYFTYSIDILSDNYIAFIVMAAMQVHH